MTPVPKIPSMHTNQSTRNTSKSFDQTLFSSTLEASSFLKTEIAAFLNQEKTNRNDSPPNINISVFAVIIN